MSAPPPKKRQASDDDTLLASTIQKAMRYKNQDDDDEPYGSDDELPDESVEDHASWRKDDTYSDWTIIIKVTNPHTEEDDNDDDDKDEYKNKEFTYKVHKERLAFGPRRSGYFARLFGMDGTFVESQDCTSRIELNELATKAFPDFLDYMYMPRQKMKFDSENATALYFLGKYFDVQRLRNEAKKFCQKEMCKKTWFTYYEHAKILQADSILVLATTFFGNNIQQILKVKSTTPVLIRARIADISDAKFWLHVMEEQVEKGTISNISLNLSCYITYFCKHHNPSPEIFKQMTDEKFLPNIHPQYVLHLLNSELEILGEVCNHDEGQLSNLQIRCVNAIVRGKVQSELQEHNVFFKFSPSVLREIITRSFNGIPEEQQQQQQQQPDDA